MKTLAALATAAVLAAVPATRQGADSTGPMAMTDGHCTGMAGGTSPAMILEQRDALELTDDQVRKLEEAADQMARARAAVAEAGVEVRDLLTPEQQETLTDLAPGGHGMMGAMMGEGGMMGDGGMMGAGSMHGGDAGSMMDCPMMGGMDGTEGMEPAVNTPGTIG